MIRKIVKLRDFGYKWTVVAHDVNIDERGCRILYSRYQARQTIAQRHIVRPEARKLRSEINALQKMLAELEELY